MRNPIYAYVLNVDDLYTDFVDNIFKRAWALFYAHILMVSSNAFKQS